MVSIIIPTFNYGHLIAETLNCLQAQTYQFWEAIIIDDGSNDDTEVVVESFIKIDPRFSYIRQANQGVAVARNLGLKLAEGDFIQFLDADDLISENKIELQINYLKENIAVDICVVNTKFFNSQNKSKLYTDFALRNKTFIPEIYGSGYTLISDFLKRNPLVIQSPLFRKSVIDKIGSFKNGMHYLEDWDFWFRAASANLCFGFLKNDSALALVRVHSQSATQQSIKIIEAEILFRDLAKNNLLKSGLSDSQKKDLITENDKLRIDTYKKIMAQTYLYELKKFVQYYKEINNTMSFLKALLKALNIKRKTIYSKKKV
ncbi:glycosyltransferase involved in cell wall biosynthesis [Pedobacter psychrotolerans]|nr:glycosyltransferase family 2 protein [Pedobacter psychrotolerans]TCO23883.1 glycosyltransferase involved in cell wall biosynthesis [Pedobacter psychrotolerans]